MRAKPYRPGATEKQVTAAVLDAARCCGIILERQNVGAMAGASGRPVRFGVPGDPDWRGVIPKGPRHGVSVWVEVKREGFNPSKLRGDKRKHFSRQIERMQAINARGEFAFWVSNAEDALKAFRVLIGLTPSFRFEFTKELFPLMAWED